MKPLLNSRHTWQVWDDWTYMTAVAISNAVDYRQEREEQYKKIAARYNKTELRALAGMYAATVEELEREPEQDFLGNLYMQLGLGDHWKGQFFTPYYVCRAMAEMTVTENVSEAIKERGYITIADSACGGGATLIAAYHAAKKQLEKIGRNAQECVLIVAQDISQMTACMCYIQLSLLGIAAVVKVGDSLLNPFTGNPLLAPPAPDLWFTPMFCFPTWAGRRICAKMDYSLQRR